MKILDTNKQWLLRDLVPKVQLRSCLDELKKRVGFRKSKSLETAHHQLVGKGRLLWFANLTRRDYFSRTYSGNRNFNLFSAQMCVDTLKQFGEKGRMIVRIGARNQNHFETRRMAFILAEGPPNCSKTKSGWIRNIGWVCTTISYKLDFRRNDFFLVTKSRSA